MTADLTVPRRWVEGHLSNLEDQAACVEHAWRAAQNDQDRRLRAAELAGIHEAQRAWREVQCRITEQSPRRRTREHR